jgi:proline iminopeptidase
VTQVVANQISLEYEARGDQQLPTVILMRGLGTQLIDWPEALLEGLVEQGFHVVVFDNRDVGLSETFTQAGLPDLSAIVRGDRGTLAYDLQDMANDVIGLMDALGIQRAHVMGISMGGMIAQLLAATHGARLLSMISMMSSSGRRGLPGATPAAQASLVASPDPAGGKAAAIALTAEGLLICGSPAYPESLEQRLAIAQKRFDRNHNPAGVARQMAAVVATGDRTRMLEQIKIPVLVIHGADDPLIPLAAGEDTAKHIPGCQLNVIEGLGHNIPAGAVPILLDTMVDFYRSIT